MISRTVIFNLVGSLCDKGLPIIVTAFLTKFMTPIDYGHWSLFFAFLLITYSVISTPLLTLFARKFYTYKLTDQGMYLYFFRFLLLLLLACILIFYSFFAVFQLISIIEILAVVLMSLYIYLGLFLRYKKWEMFYMKHSISRLIIFIAVIGISLWRTGKVSYFILLISFVLCHIPSLVISFRYILFPSKDTVKEDLKEFTHLTIYGATTSMVGSLDKLIISGLGFSLSFLGYYSFIYALTNVPTIIIEALKKTITPRMFQEWTTSNKLSKKTKTKILITTIILLLTQFVLPQLTYSVLKKLDLINAAFIRPESVYYIFLLSIGCYFFSLYHFINPKYFFNKKALQLLFIQLASLFFYFIAIFLIKTDLSIKTFILLKVGLLTSVTISTFLLTKLFIKKKPVNVNSDFF